VNEGFLPGDAEEFIKSMKAAGFAESNGVFIGLRREW
jgi:hypothetical protein